MFDLERGVKDVISKMLYSLGVLVRGCFEGNVVFVVNFFGWEFCGA